MISSIFVWLLAFFILMGLLALVVFQLMCLADLEYDYMNPYDAALRINRVVIAEFVLQGGLGLFFLLTGHWVMFLLSLPYAYYNARQYQDGGHLIDVTEVFRILNKAKKIRMIKMAYCFVLLFVSLFWLIWNVVEENE